MLRLALSYSHTLLTSIANLFMILTCADPPLPCCMYVFLVYVSAYIIALRLFFSVVSPCLSGAFQAVNSEIPAHSLCL